MIERWEKLMADSVQEDKLAVGQSDSTSTIFKIKDSVSHLTKMQMLEDKNLENLNMKGKLVKIETLAQRMEQSMTEQRTMYEANIERMEQSRIESNRNVIALTGLITELKAKIHSMESSLKK